MQKVNQQLNSDVKITKSQPAKRVYGAEAEAQEKAKKAAQAAK